MKVVGMTPPVQAAVCLVLVNEFVFPLFARVSGTSTS